MLTHTEAWPVDATPLRINTYLHITYNKTNAQTVRFFVCLTDLPPHRGPAAADGDVTAPMCFVLHDCSQAPPK